MTTTRLKRRAFEAGHRRKFLVVIDEAPEVETAMFFAANRIRRTAGSMTLLYVIEPVAEEHWMGVRDVYLEEQTKKAEAIFRLFRRKLKNEGYEDLEVEEVVREGKKSEQIINLINQDADIGVLVLGASTDPAGPGPSVSPLATGKLAGSFPVPITVVPGTLTLEEIKAMARRVPAGTASAGLT